MTVSVKIEGGEEVRQYLESMPPRLFTEAKKAFGATAADVHAKVSARIRNGSPLYSRTGTLRRSMNFTVYGTSLTALGANVYSDKTIAKYAPTHEYGATITAKNAYLGVPGGPFLNIPANENKTPAGVPRMSAREVFANGGYLRPISNGRYAVFMDGVPMFWLVKSVTIPPRLEMVNTAEGEVPTLLGRLAAATGEAIK